MRSSFRWMLVAAAAGCSGPTSPAHEGFADVDGQVLQASGAPLANSTVAVACGNAAVTSNAITDASGRFSVNLHATAATMADFPSGQLKCSFGSPNLLTPQSHAEADIYFAAAGLHAVQGVTLRASP